MVTVGTVLFFLLNILVLDSEWSEWSECPTEMMFLVEWQDFSMGLSTPLMAFLSFSSLWLSFLKNLRV